MTFSSIQDLQVPMVEFDSNQILYCTLHENNSCKVYKQINAVLP